MSLYALNLFDLEENNLYRRYSRRSAEAVAKNGGKVVALETLEEALQSYPGTEARTVMILVEWSSQESFRAFLDDPELKDLRLLREGGTRNYQWWIYERLEDLRSLFQAQLESNPS